MKNFIFLKTVRAKQIIVYYIAYERELTFFWRASSLRCAEDESYGSYHTYCTYRLSTSYLHYIHWIFSLPAHSAINNRHFDV